MPEGLGGEVLITFGVERPVVYSVSAFQPEGVATNAKTWQVF